MTTNKNKSEPSMSLCQDFHILCEFPWSSRSHHGRLEFWSLLALTYAENTVTHIFGDKVPYWVVRGHLLADDDLKKTVPAKMIGMPLPVDCWRTGIWWWDSWCSSRCHCYGYECVDTGVSAVNERGNTSENQADTIVVHSDLIGEL